MRGGKKGSKQPHNETNMPQELSKKLQLKQHEQEINNTALLTTQNIK